MHWALPAHTTRFLELIRSEATSDTAVEQAAALAVLTGKEACAVQRDVPGFIVNRLGYAMYREAFHLLEAGVADAETIDRAFRNSIGLWASFCGPFRWIDLTGGPALKGRAMRGVLPSLSRETGLSPMLAGMVEREAGGMRDGHGVYEYAPGDAKQWEEGYSDCVWRVKEFIDQTFPLSAKPPLSGD